NMTDFPKQARYWKRDLTGVTNAYNLLGKMLKDKNFIRREYFDAVWMNEDSDTILPREKIHWSTICELLGYSESVSKRAWFHLKLNFLKSIKNQLLDAFFSESNDINNQNPVDRLIPI